MGFLDDLRDTVSDRVEGATRGIASNPLSFMNPVSLPFAALDADRAKRDQISAMEDQEKRAQATTEAARANLGRLRDRASSMAASYRSQLPAYQRGLIDVAQRTNRQQMAEKLQKQNENLNSRGLISGGVAQGKAAKVAADSRAQMAQQENDINMQVADQADEFDDYVANIGMNLAGFDADKQNDYFKDALKRLQDRQSAYGAAGNVLGNVVGRYAAGRQGAGGYEFDEVS